MRDAAQAASSSPRIKQLVQLLLYREQGKADEREPRPFSPDRGSSSNWGFREAGTSLPPSPSSSGVEPCLSGVCVCCAGRYAAAPALARPPRGPVGPPGDHPGTTPCPPRSHPILSQTPAWSAPVVQSVSFGCRGLEGRKGGGLWVVVDRCEEGRVLACRNGGLLTRMDGDVASARGVACRVASSHTPSAASRWAVRAA